MSFVFDWYKNIVLKYHGKYFKSNTVVVGLRLSRTIYSIFTHIIKIKMFESLKPRNVNILVYVDDFSIYSECEL